MPQTIFEAYNLCKKRLLAAGIDDEVFEAKQIIKHITGMTSAQIISNYNAQLTEFQQNMLTAVIHQREAHYPLQYISAFGAFTAEILRWAPVCLSPVRIPKFWQEKRLK